MKRRIISLLLCAAMLFTAALMSGCATASGAGSTGTDTGGSDILSRSSMTLTLWMPTYEGTTEDALEDVEEAINKITQAQFDTAIKLYGIPSDEYEAAVKKQLEDITARVAKEDEEALARRKAEREAAKRGETYVPEETAADDFVSPYDLIVNSAAGYAHVGKNQMDIFLIRGIDDYRYYANNMYLESLDEQIAGSAKLLKSYIYTDFFDAVELDGLTYAIPNNHAVGEYKYFLVNKRIASELGIDEMRLRTLNACKNQGFVEKIAASYPGVTPVYGNIVPTYMQYWSGSERSSFSTLASRVLYDALPDKTTLQNIFDINNFNDYTYLSKLYTEQGYVSTAATVNEFGVGIIEATPAEIAKYEDDYYINVYERPMGTADDYCQAMFAVSSFTKSTERCMEIINLLNTTQELRTVLQYGVEGEHWKKDEADESIIVKLSDDYKMKLEETGNVYMTYPDYNTPIDWQSEKDQNLASYYPITYNLKDYVFEGNTELVKSLDALNATIKAQIDSMNAATYNNSIPTLKAQVDANDAFQKLSYIPSSNDTQKGRTEENGWFADKSIAFMWSETVKALTGQK